MDLTDRNAKPSRDGLEDHQRWVWMWDEPQPRPHPLAPWWTMQQVYGQGEDPSGHWEIVGTGAVL